MLKYVIQSLFQKGSFVRNLFKLSSGKAVIFLIGFFATPIISRVFTPEAYGVFAIYNVIIVNASVFISLQLYNSFVIIQDENEFRLLARTTHTLILFGSCLLGLILLLFDKYLFGRVEINEIIGIWYLFAIGVYFHSMRSFFGLWHVREKSFNQANFLTILEALGIKGSVIGIGTLLSALPKGLVFGEIIGRFLNFILQFSFFGRKKANYLLPVISVKSIKQVLRKYRDYPLYVTPSIFLDQLGASLIILFISFLYSPESVGSFSMARNLLMIPVVLIAYAAQPVLMQKISENKQNEKPNSLILDRFISFTFLITCIPVIAFVLLGKILVLIFLGPDWETSAAILSWISALLPFEILFVSLNGVLIGLEKNRKLLKIGLLRIIGTLSIFFVILIASTSFIQSIKIYIIGSLVLQMLMILFLIKHIGIKEKLKKYFLIESLYLSIIAMVFYSIDFY